MFILLFATQSLAKYFGFEADEMMFNFITLYYILRVGITWLIPQVSRSVVKSNEFIYYYPKRINGAQKTLRIPLEDIVKIAIKTNEYRSIYLTYWHEGKEKKLQIHAYHKEELDKLQKLYNCLTLSNDVKSQYKYTT